MLADPAEDSKGCSYFSSLFGGDGGCEVCRSRVIKCGGTLTEEGAICSRDAPDDMLAAPESAPEAEDG